jgi:endonuclease/exonuclease/phosphatase family metal-dependent hydrolase
VRLVLVTWNLKGAANPDVAAVADHLRSQAADVVALQEVQWHQARRIARALGARSRRWSLKHWPARTWPEGMAIIGVTRPVRVRSRALSYRWRLWSWRRRIVQVADVGTPTGSEGGQLTLVNVHLTPHGRAELRAIETGAVLGLADRAGPVVVIGDFNELPGEGIHGQLAAAGFHDCWSGSPAAPGGALPTNWRGWRRGTTTDPVQTLDYVYVSPAVTAVAVNAPRVGDDEFARFAGLSDHLPVTAVLDLP